MGQLSWLAAVPLIAFWMWMFAEMWRNPALPPNMRNYWTIAFLFFNVFAAAYYWATVYRDRA